MRRRERAIAVGWSQKILGEPASKANSRRVTRQGRFIKSAKALAYQKAFIQQVIPPPEPIRGTVCVEVSIAYKSWRPDLDESLILDLLQRARVIVNDRQVVERYAVRLLPSSEPHATIYVYPVTYPGRIPKGLT